MKTRKFTRHKFHFRFTFASRLKKACDAAHKDALAPPSDTKTLCSRNFPSPIKRGTRVNTSVIITIGNHLARCVKNKMCSGICEMTSRPAKRVAHPLFVCQILRERNTLILYPNAHMLFPCMNYTHR